MRQSLNVNANAQNVARLSRIFVMKLIDQRNVGLAKWVNEHRRPTDRYHSRQQLNQQNKCCYRCECDLFIVFINKWRDRQLSRVEQSAINGMHMNSFHCIGNDSMNPMYGRLSLVNPNFLNSDNEFIFSP